MQPQKDLLKIGIFLEFHDWTEGHHLLPQADHTGGVGSIGEHPPYGDGHVLGKVRPQRPSEGQIGPAHPTYLCDRHRAASLTSTAWPSPPVWSHSSGRRGLEPLPGWKHRRDLIHGAHQAPKETRHRGPKPAHEPGLPPVSLQKAWPLRHS